MFFPAPSSEPWNAGGGGEVGGEGGGRLSRLKERCCDEGKMKEDEKGMAEEDVEEVVDDEGDDEYDERG